MCMSYEKEQDNILRIWAQTEHEPHLSFEDDNNSLGEELEVIQEIDDGDQAYYVNEAEQDDSEDRNEQAEAESFKNWLKDGI